MLLLEIEEVWSLYETAFNCVLLCPQRDLE
jgi:hypothetical protein